MREDTMDTLPNKMVLSALLLLSLWPASLRAAETQQAADQSLILIKAARLYDGTGAAPISDAAVLVRGSVIEQVGEASAISAPEEAEVIDLGDETLMPGLFDTHGHLRYRYAGGGALGRAAQATGSHGPTAMRMVKNARTQLLSGITTMRMVSEVGFLDFDIKQAIDSGMILGPRIIPSGLLITSTGGHGAYNPDWGIDGPWEAVELVRKNFHHGARLIKLSMMDLSPEAAQLTVEEVKAAVDAAHDAGIPVTAHCTGRWGSAIRTAVAGGVDTIEHARPLSDEIIRLLVENGTSVSLTPLVYIGFRPDASWWKFLDHQVERPEQWIHFMRDQMIEWRRKHPQWETEDRPYEDGETNRATRDYFPGVKNRQAEVLKAYRAGIPMGLGLDTIYGGITLTMEWLVEAGIPLKDVIHMATGSAAGISRVDEKVGTLQPGKLADIISVQGDPQQDIQNLHRIHLVMKEGRRYDQHSWN